MDYVFKVHGLIADEFRPQAGELSDLILELGGRIHLPRTWKLVDWLHDRPKASPEIVQKRKKHQTALGILLLLLAMFALGPAVIAPGELLSVLLTGMFCLGLGIGSLWNRHRILLGAFLIPAGLFYGIAGLGGGKEFHSLVILGVGLIAVGTAALIPRKKSRHNPTAVQDVSSLFECRHSIPKNQPVCFRFTEKGLQAFTEEGKGKIQAYDDFSGVLETEDLLVIVMGNQGILLAKDELVNSEFSDFKAELSEKILWITKKGKNEYGKTGKNFDRRF